MFAKYSLGISATFLALFGNPNLLFVGLDVGYFQIRGQKRQYYVCGQRFINTRR